VVTSFCEVFVQGAGQPQQYYMMNPVMAVAYNAALAALTGQPHTPDAGFMGAAMPMHAPFPMQPHMAAFGSVPMHGASQVGPDLWIGS
jgi:hypothetical protein